MMITVMGTPCSGKSTLALRLAKHFGLTHYSIGDLRRKAAAEKGMTLAEYNKLGETEDTDTSFDEYQKKLAEIEDNWILDGRMSAYFAPKAIHIFLDADEEIRAKRMLTPDPDHPRINEPVQNIEEARKLIQRRVVSDRSRYTRLYNFDPYSPEGYDIVLDTSRLSKEEAEAELIRQIEAHVEKDLKENSSS